MNPLMLIKGELRRSFGGILALALVLALSLSLGVGVSMTERAVRQGTARAGDAFDLLVGAQGSSVQLMLGAVYLRPQSLPLVPGGAVTEILTQEGVVWAAPLAFGDRWNASPLVGTTTDMVTLGGNRTLAEGRAFAAQDEAVLGAGVPLRLGEAFSPMHGQVSASHNEHGHVRYKAVGRLPETGTPWDNAILIPIESVWAVHDALPDAGHGLPLGHLFEGKGSPLPGVSAVVVKPESIAAAYRLRAFWQTATLPDADGRPVNMQGVFTGEVLTELFATLGDMRDIMTGMAYAAQFVALCGVMLVGGMAVSMRKRMLGTLRVLGAPRAYLVLSVWCVVSVSIAVGTLAGLLFGCGLSEGAALLMFRQTGIMLSPQLTLAEGSFAAASFALGSLCALFPPIWSTARREPSHWGIANSPFPRTDAAFYRFRAGKTSRYLYPLAPESARLRKQEHGPDARLLFRLLPVQGRRPRRGQARLQRPSAGSGNSDGTIAALAAEAYPPHEKTLSGAITAQPASNETESLPRRQREAFLLAWGGTGGTE